MLGVNLCGSLVGGGFCASAGGLVNDAEYCGACGKTPLLATASAAIAAAVPAAVVLLVTGTLAGRSSCLTAGVLVRCLATPSMPRMDMSRSFSESVRLASGTVVSTQALIALSTFLSSPGSDLCAR